MAKNVRRNTLRLQGRAFDLGGLDVLIHDVLDSITTQLLISSVNEESFTRLAISFLQPLSNRGGYFLSQRDAPCLATFSSATDVRARF
jgi:hypothetical protein